MYFFDSLNVKYFLGKVESIKKSLYSKCKCHATGIIMIFSRINQNLCTLMRRSTVLCAGMNKINVNNVLGLQ